MATQVTGDEILNLPGYRQDDTSNTTKSNVRIVYGWGVMTPGVAFQASEAVAFPITFAQRPIVVITFGGDATSATTYGSGGDTIKDSVIMKAHTITTTGFTVKGVTRDVTNYAAGNTIFYQWMAIGEL